MPMLQTVQIVLIILAISTLLLILLNAQPATQALFCTQTECAITKLAIFTGATRVRHG